VIFVLAWLIFAWVSYPGKAGEYFSTHSFNPDFFEYHLPATNLALYGRFPVYGFIGPISKYKLCPQPDSVKYYRDTRAAGVIIFPSKPPLYSFLAGMAYRIFGFSPQTAVNLNVALLSLAAVLIVLIGYHIFGMWGFFVGLLSALLWLLYRRNDVWNFDAEVLTAAMCAVVVFFGALLRVRPKKGYHFLLGMAMGCLLLAKGYFAFGALLLCLYYIYKFISGKVVQHVQRLLWFAAGCMVVMLPWMIHINRALQQDIPNRLMFHQKLKATAPKLLLHSRDEIFTPEGTFREDVIEDLLKFHQYQHAIENGFVIISNQLGDYNILNVHNEYCTDGDFHPEWRIITHSFYHRHQDKHKHHKLWLFYLEHPALLVKLSWAKIVNTFYPESVLFYLAGLLLLLLTGMYGKLPKLLYVPATLLFNIAVAIVVFYGDVRFVQTVDVAAIVAILSAVMFFFRKKIV
jgi:4-amino-4-deoxy-L-arabinose transferase-like glycosyltransferase